MRVVLASMLVCGATFAQQPTAEEIMTRVAANQDRAVAARERFVFTHTSRVRLLKRNRKPVWDETRVYAVAPTAEGLESELVRSYGERKEKGDQVVFEFDGEKLDEGGIDSSLVNSLHDEFSPQRRERDGFWSDLYPFTSKQNGIYRYSLLAETMEAGRKVYRIGYEPVDKRSVFHDGGAWEGEVVVDAAEWQPVRISSNLAKKVPLWARTFFGINLRQLGFGTSYERLEEDVWFPASYGGEFTIKLFHFYRRLATISVVAGEFRRTDTESSIEYEMEAAAGSSTEPN